MELQGAYDNSIQQHEPICAGSVLLRGCACSLQPDFETPLKMGSFRCAGNPNLRDDLLCPYRTDRCAGPQRQRPLTLQWGAAGRVCARCYLGWL